MKKNLLCAAALILLACTCEISRQKDEPLKIYATKSFNKPTGRKKWTAPISYYPNSTACFRLLICGDIESNPGPTPCQSCKKTVKINSKRFECELCKNITHEKCTKGTVYRIQNPRIPAKWTCSSCLLSYLPFHQTRDINSLYSSKSSILSTHNRSVDPEECPHLKNLTSKGTSIAHLNTQSIASSFAEFETMLNIYKFDVMTLSETWLKDNKTLLEHIQIPGYKFEYVNRQNKGGGGVGCYIKDHLEYKSDMTSTVKIHQ